MWNPFKRKATECYFFFSFSSDGGNTKQTRGVIGVIHPSETSLDAVNRIGVAMKDSGDIQPDALLVSLSIYPARP